jgi:hypothetical protein
MNKLLLLLFSLAAASCYNKPQPGNNTIGIQDTITPLTDTAIAPAYAQPGAADSLARHYRDSLDAIKPVAVFTFDKEGDPFDKLVARMIDTTGIVKQVGGFRDTTLITTTKNEKLIAERHIIKGKGYVVEVSQRDETPYGAKKLFINGRAMRPGKEIDTSLSGTIYTEVIDIDAAECAILRYGAREYLFLPGYIKNCNGMGCGVSFYILYDPLIKKAMLLQQFRTSFLDGYDVAGQTPVFIDMEQDIDNYSRNAGKVYRFNHQGRIEKVLNRAGRSYFFEGYWKNDSVVVTRALFPGK